MIEIQNVSFEYEKSQGTLSHIDLNIQQGECIVLTGESGCGKTTITQDFSRMSYKEMEEFMGNENRERLALRMQPETRRRIEQWYAADNCQSMNEFVEKAVNFYVDHLEIQDNQTLLPMAIQSAIDGRLRRMEDYIARSSFTRNVEQDMTNGIIAEAFEMDREDLKRRRAQSVRNVKATNGLISLEKYARSRQEPDWDDDEWQD